MNSVLFTHRRFLFCCLSCCLFLSAQHSPVEEGKATVQQATQPTELMRNIREQGEAVLEYKLDIQPSDQPIVFTLYLKAGETYHLSFLTQQAQPQMKAVLLSEEGEYLHRAEAADTNLLDTYWTPRRSRLVTARLLPASRTGYKRTGTLLLSQKKN